MKTTRKWEDQTNTHTFMHLKMCWFVPRTAKISPKIYKKSKQWKNQQIVGQSYADPPTTSKFPASLKFQAGLESRLNFSIFRLKLFDVIFSSLIRNIYYLWYSNPNEPNIFSKIFKNSIMEGHREKKEFFHCRVIQTPAPHSRVKLDEKIEIFLYAIQTYCKSSEKWET